MAELHQAYLSLGSNIDASDNLTKAVEMLREAGDVPSISSVWESESVGFNGPNFLNVCVVFRTFIEKDNLKEVVIRPIEARLGRVRGAEKSAPRTVDIDLLLYDETPLNTDFWEYAFVVVPLAELIPNFIHPIKRKKLLQVSKELRNQVWIEKRPGVILNL